MTQPKSYIWQKPSWPAFKWQDAALIKLLGACRFQQGALLSQMKELGFDVRQKTRAEVLIQEAMKTSEIEGERLDPTAVRSSVARRLGLSTVGLQTTMDQRAEGVVDILLDATQNFNQPLTAERLQGWQAALFPTGYSGINKIRVADWRDDRQGPMRVVSGPIGREKVHYEAPPSERLSGEMEKFLRWWSSSGNGMDGILRAGLGHLWFVAVHPFEDGNGRIARTLAEMALSQDENITTRYYSLSSQIMSERDAYYEILESTNRGEGDITGWLQWFLECMHGALFRSHERLTNITLKHRFWLVHAETPLNARQSKVLNRVLDAGPGGFEGGLTNRKYAGMTHTSRATAQRELADLVKKGLLYKKPGGGRSSSYDLDWEALASPHE